ncbi:MAG: Crp/Fnr family transcriptional regulator [Clostridiales bacterium]|nr:Crp/Fnr family transcriptional regulator [Clostridiales bacterium]
MEFSNYFPIWDKLDAQQQEVLRSSALERTAKKGTLIHRGSMDCLGLVIVVSGRLRAYSLSPDGKEVTLYRLLERDTCLLSAACMMSGMQFELMIEAERDTAFYIVPPDVFKNLMNSSAVIANYANELMATRFSEVMWLMEQIMWKSLDKRIAGFLLEESLLEGTKILKITHEQIANHLGSAREVVTRMLKYFQSEGLVRITRGTVEITDEKRLGDLLDDE